MSSLPPEYTPSIPQGSIRLSYAEYVELPDDGKRYEIIEGNLLVSPAPRPRHQRILRRLLRFLEPLESGGELLFAPIDVILDPHTVVQPALLFIREERRHIVGARAIEEPPDLIVEILSASTRRTDVLVKSRAYAAFRVPWYWLVDPEVDRVEAFRLQADSYTLVAAAQSPEVLEVEGFAGVKIALANLFA